MENNKILKILNYNLEDKYDLTDYDFNKYYFYDAVKCKDDVSLFENNPLTKDQVLSKIIINDSYTNLKKFIGNNIKFETDREKYKKCYIQNKLYREIVLEILRSSNQYPDWAKMLLQNPIKTREGSFKKIYIYDNKAFSIELNVNDNDLEKRNNIYKILKTIHYCKVNYPLDYFILTVGKDKFLISKLRYCPKGSLLEYMEKKNGEKVTDLTIYENIYKSYYICYRSRVVSH